MAGKWIQKMNMKKGALTATAKRAGKSLDELCSSPNLSGRTAKRCALRKTLRSFHK
jgi:hypothetical protein